MASRKAREALALMEFAGDFATACNKIKQGAETPASAVTLTQEECRAMITALRLIARSPDEGK